MNAAEASQLTVLIALLTVLVAYLASLVAGYAWEQGRRWSRLADETRHAVLGAWDPALSAPLGTVEVRSDDTTQPIEIMGGVSA